jgi:hypothetical protein
MRFRPALVLSTLALLAACDSSTPEQRAQWEHDAARPMVCSNALQCEVMWSRALEFVQHFSECRIVSATKYAIVTAKPKFPDTHYGYTITRIHNADGTQQLAIKLDCENGLGCDPPPAKAFADFHNYVLQ